MPLFSTGRRSDHPQVRPPVVLQGPLAPRVSELIALPPILDPVSASRLLRRGRHVPQQVCAKGRVQRAGVRRPPVDEHPVQRHPPSCKARPNGGMKFCDHRGGRLLSSGTRPPPPSQGKEKRQRVIVVVRSPCQEHDPADAHPQRAQVGAGVGKPPHGLGVCIWMHPVNGTGQQPVSGTADPRSSQTGQVIRGLR